MHVAISSLWDGWVYRRSPTLNIPADILREPPYRGFTGESQETGEDLAGRVALVDGVPDSYRQVFRQMRFFQNLAYPHRTSLLRKVPVDKASNHNDRRTDAKAPQSAHQLQAVDSGHFVVDNQAI